ncbi:GNAT family N-acetyltransferase [Gryllotalpicola ginsengisoli]|uniref:GNAT family N-acetyltransferase n=1 Tax=Gryllotalpicola ginsengisoli TaxID=444608 RepID=UPI0003B4E18A|nr:GNAT family N-acetyltransferase [Gryllotalpicola ginsengisoli]
MKVEVTRVSIPSDVAAPEASDFVESCDVANASEVETWGGDEFVYPPEATLSMFRGSAHHSRFVWLAKLDGLPVGRVVVTFPLDEADTGAELAVDVVPVARGRGIGSALLAHGEEFIATGGRVDVAGFTQHRLTERSAPFVISESDRDARFLARRGYRLAQTQVMDELALPVPPLVLRELWRQAPVGDPEYRLVQWWRRTPNEFLDRYARLRSLMARDVPHDGLVVERAGWDAARVRAVEARAAERGRPALVTAALHVASGELVGYTEIAVPQGAAKVEQHDTLVIGPHRGHRLGLWMKLANLKRLAEAAPRAQTVLTWTATGNAPMRRINRALGFAPRGLLGNWHKRLD